MEMKEKNLKKKGTRNQTIWQEPSKRDKYLCYPPRKILGTILEVYQRKIKQMD